MEYQNIELEDIIKWCQEHNQIEWLKATASKKVKHKSYPRVAVDKEVIDKKTGLKKTKRTMVVDKTQPFTLVEEPITFVELKKEFRDTFLKDEMPPKEKKPSMYERIAALQSGL